uniref:ATP-dependent DNA helicase n=1 Tax=Thermofilum adornatum TaxID=1365176 RepID=A0A7C1CED4_9CREN
MYRDHQKREAEILEVKNYIPYKRTRSGQIQLALAVKEAFEDKKILLARYPTGIGKTVSVIAGALAAGAPKIIYLARSRSQFQAPVREVKRLEAVGVNVPTVVLMNKQKYCLLKGASRLAYQEFLHFCWYKRKTGACPYFTDIKTKMELPEILTPKTSRELGLGSGVCPFEVTWSNLKNARLIVASYPYIFSSDLRKRLEEALGGSLGNSILIIDEAHNLPGFIVDAESYHLSENDLKRALSLVRNSKASAEIISELTHALNYLRRYRHKVGSTFSVSLDEVLQNMPSPESLSRYLFGSDQPAETSTFIWRVYTFLQALRGASHEYIASVTAGDEGVSLRLTLVNPRRVGSQVFSSVRSAVLMSGTLPTREYLQVMLDIPSDRILETSYPNIWGSNVEVVIVEGLTSRYTARTEDLYRKYAKAIDLIFSYPGVKKTVAVFPSYSFMLNIVPYIQSRPLVFERRDTSLKSMIEKVLENEKILVCVVARGKFVEGVEYTVRGKSLIDTIIIAGLPVPEPTLENEKMYELLSEKLGSRDLAWKYVYLYPAYMQVVQSIGRGIRSEKDRVKVYVLDERMKGEGEAYLSSFDFMVKMGKLPL